MAAFVIAAGIVLARIYPEYSGMLPALGVMAGILGGAAWAARAVHAASTRPVRPRRTLRWRSTTGS
jgi:drug/metabolite transporter (DMT)-like permease